ncbi:Uncharacterised protein [Neisseria meningitidis]|nr:Uncharacterised protein [Neisseria meningitidis]CWS04550.1 Uncharacterised protein [Neisseria meningitidis]
MCIMCELKTSEEILLVLRDMTKIHLLANGMMTGCGMMKNIGNWRMI